MTAIDFHAHLVDLRVYAVTAQWSVFAKSLNATGMGEEARRAAQQRSDAVIAGMADIERRIAAMDKMGVGIQVLSSSLVHQCTYDAAPSDALQLDRVMNDRVAEAILTHPSRFRGLGSIPLQAPDLAVGELDRCMTTLGLSGVTISTRVREMEIGNAALKPFWQKAEELGAVIFIHPAGNPDARFAPFQLWNSIGQSFEEAMAIASLFYDGILEIYPKLKIVVSHGGGYMPFYLGRIARNYIEKPATRANMSRPPLDYLRMLYYDTCVYDPDTLAQLVKIVGADRIVMGSDYPVGDTLPVDFIRDCNALSAADQDKIVSGNATTLLGL